VAAPPDPLGRDTPLGAARQPAHTLVRHLPTGWPWRPDLTAFLAGAPQVTVGVAAVALSQLVVLLHIVMPEPVLRGEH
jgi:hypothetical protein